MTSTGGPRRIAHVLAPALFGGLETVVQLLAAGQAARGHDVVVIATIEESDPDAHPFVRTLRSAGMRVEVVRATGRRYAEERRGLGRILRDVRPDVVHTHGYRADILHLPTARRARIATATTLHGFTGGDWKMRLYERIQLRAVARADAVVCVSRPIMSRLTRRGVHASRLHFVQNAFAAPHAPLSRADARRMLDVPDDALAIGWVGRLSNEKAPDLAIDAMRELSTTGGRPATLWVLGDGQEMAALRERARAHGIAERVVFKGPVPAAGRLLRAFDVLLLSSRTEGTPMVILEAMAAETPIVATTVGGIPDVLTPASASLVRPDDAHALADALRATLADADAARTRASQGSADLRSRFGVEQWLDRHDAIYASILQHALRN